MALEEAPRTGQGVTVGGRTPSGQEQTSPEESTGHRVPLLERVQSHERTATLLEVADEFLAAQGFTEHGRRHATLVGHIAFNVLTHLDHSERTAELAAVAGYLHDLGNVVSRANHGQTSGLLAFDLLRELDVPTRDIAHVMGAVGNHEESYGVAVSVISAAVIVADKSDVHRSRVRDTGNIETDIHDRVNYAVTSSFLRVDPEKHTLNLELEVDQQVTPVFEYFEIFMERMVMCRRAARTLGCDFKITVNDVAVL